MTLVVCWLLFPVVLACLCAGCGLLVDACAGRVLRGSLVVPVGFATVIVLAQLTTWHGATAPLTLPLVPVAAVAGFATWWRRATVPGGWPLAAAVATFVVYALPTVLTGDVTWAGFYKLDDTATWFAMTDRLLSHGTDLTEMAPSSHREILRTTLGAGYPTGSLLALAVGRPLVGQDVAWVFQPYLAYAGALLALGLHALVVPVVRSGALSAVAAFVAAQATLLYGFSLWGGVKEMVAAMLLPVIAATIPPLWRSPLRLRSVLPAGVATGAFASTFGPAAAPWAGIAALLAVAGVVLVAARGRDLGRNLAKVGVVAAGALALALSTVLLSPQFRATTGALRAGAADENIGNLLAPLDTLQVFGIWPSLDFRVAPEHLGVTHVLIAVLAAAAVSGLVLLVRRRGLGLGTYVVTMAIASTVALQLTGAWVDAKTLAMTAPLVVALGMTGALGWAAAGRSRAVTVVGVLAAAAIGGGVAWSNVSAYRGVSPAPGERMAELATIGERFAGESPALTTEYNVYADRHFLRRLDDESAASLRWRPVLLADGDLPPPKITQQIDAFRLDQVLVYRTLVLRSMPSSSRPPSAFRRVWRGTYYDVWIQQRGPDVLEHVALGDENDAAAVPDCATVRRLGASAARQGAQLVAAPRPRSSVVGLTPPPGSDWTSRANGIVVPSSAGSVVGDLDIPRAGRYAIWLGGSFGRSVEVSVDGIPVGALRDERQDDGQLLRVGTMDLPAGRRLLAVKVADEGWRPGEADLRLPTGPVVVTPDGDPPPLETVPARRAASLCGRSLDWVEVVRR